MFFFKLLALYFLIYAILFLSGWGICRYICKGKNEKYKFVLSPIIGMIPLSLVPMYFSFLGVKTLVSGWVTVVFFTSLSLYYLIKYPPNLKKELPSFFLFLLVIIGVLPSFVLILNAGYLTTTLQSYPVFIVNVADYLIHNSVFETVNLDFDKPFTNMFNERQKLKPFAGYFFLISTISAIFNIPPYKLYLVLSGIAGSFVPISVFIACKEGFKLEKRISLLISFLISINISYFFWPIIGHFPYISGIVYLILVLGFMPDMFQCKKKVDFILYSLIMAGMMSMYFQVAPYVIGVALFYILLRKKRIPNILELIKNAGIISILTFVITPPIFIFLVRFGAEFTAITSQFKTNIPRYPYIEELLGFGLHFTMRHDGSLKHYLMLLLSIILLFFVCGGLYSCFKKRNMLFLSVFAFIFTLGVYFSLTGFLYHFYKNSIIGVFVLVSFLVMGADFIYQNTKLTLLKRTVVIIMLIFILFNLKTYKEVALNSSHPIVTRSYIDLENISNVIPGDKLVLVNSRNPTEEVWLSYFLKDSRIKLKGVIEPWGFWIYSPFSGKPDFNFFYDYKEDNIDFTLSHNLMREGDIVDTDYGEIIYKNEAYFLSKNTPNPYLYKGWHNVEKDREGVYRWTMKNSVVLFDKPNYEAVLLLEGSIPAVYNKPVKMVIKINDKPADILFLKSSSNFRKQYSLSKFVLNESYNELSISLDKTFTPSELWDSTDLRRLGIRIKKIEFIAMK